MSDIHKELTTIPDEWFNLRHYSGCLWQRRKRLQYRFTLVSVLYSLVRLLFTLSRTLRVMFPFLSDPRVSFRGSPRVPRNWTPNGELSLQWFVSRSSFRHPALTKIIFCLSDSPRGLMIVNPIPTLTDPCRVHSRRESESRTSRDIRTIHKPRNKIFVNFR